MSNFQNCTYKI